MRRKTFHSSSRQILALTVLGILSSACGSTLKLAELDRVKTLAIVAYEARLKSPDGDGVKATFFKDRDAAKDNAIKAYEQLGGALTQKMKWAIKPHAEMIANPGYAAIFERVQNSNVFLRLEGKLAKLSENYYPDGVIWGSRAGWLTTEDRAKLFETLGVDAIAVAEVDVEVSYSTSFLMKTNAAYSAQVKFKVYAPNSDEPIWIDEMAKGDESETTSGWNFGPVTFRNQEQKAFLEAIGLGYVALITRYEEAREKALAEAAEAAAEKK